MASRHNVECRFDRLFSFCFSRSSYGDRRSRILFMTKRRKVGSGRKRSQIPPRRLNPNVLRPRSLHLPRLREALRMNLSPAHGSERTSGPFEMPRWMIQALKRSDSISFSRKSCWTRLNALLNPPKGSSFRTPTSMKGPITLQRHPRWRLSIRRNTMPVILTSP